MKASVTYIPVAAGPQPPAVPPPASGAQRITDPTLDRITQLTEAPGTSTARTFEYDAQHRLTEIKLNGVRERGYDLNDRNQRIREYSHDTKSYMQYTYDNQGQLTFYGRRETGEFEGGSPSIYFGGYTYDMVGNRLVKMWMGGDDVIYTPNVVNQYSKITEMENSWEPGIETEFAYNPDGCQLSSTGGWSYAWNGENRLISVENGDTRLEFNYDYMGRRFEKKVYTANVLTKHEKFVYDGYKLIQVLDALNSDAVTMAFAWHPESTGLDTPFSMTYDGETYYYVTDGNKNVMSLIDAAGTKAAEYVYDPFGRLLSSTGSLAEINPFRFSSEYHDDETGLVYYNYRYYSPELGRWISRDPIEEEGGVNLYAMVGNNPVNERDFLGCSMSDWYTAMKITELKIKLASLYSNFKDREGFSIFVRWVMGEGDWLDAPFGDYLKKNVDLQVKTRDLIISKIKAIDKLFLVGSYMRLDETDAIVLSDNGYSTGYELLHGTNWTVGGYRWFGQIYRRSQICFDGDLQYIWNDIIDPNFGYDKDFLSIPLRVYFGFRPRNYKIRIKFSGKFQLIYNSHLESWSFTGGFPAFQRGG